MTIAGALSQANQMIEAAINQVLNSEMANMVKEYESSAILDTVYGAYSPALYSRRGDCGGMGDRGNMEHTVSGGTLTVINTTPPNPGGVIRHGSVTVGKNLPMLIEKGNGASGFYDFPKPGAAFMRSRPFTQETISRIAEKGEHVNIMRSALRGMGFKVE